MHMERDAFQRDETDNRPPIREIRDISDVHEMSLISLDFPSALLHTYLQGSKYARAQSHGR